MKKKAFISEEDVALLSKRYSPNALLTILQEIWSCESAALNWETLAKKSNSGIKNAREYQALWRHLAYRIDLAENYEEDAQPLDDESDLEFEIEPFPSVSHEIDAEAETVIQTLNAPICGTGKKGNSLATGSWDPSTISQHYGMNGFKSTLLGTNAPVATPSDSACKVGPSGLVHSERRKRKLWTPEEDQELIAAVEEYGEGNWTNILKSAFRHDRTASQLSQRWALIRKRRDVQTAINITNPVKSSMTQVNEEAQAEPAPKAETAVGVAAPTASSAGAGTSTLVAPRKAHRLGIARSGTNLSKTAKTSSAGQTRSNLKSANIGAGGMGGRLIAPGAVVMSAAAAQAASIGGSEMWQAATMPASVLSMSAPLAGTGKLSNTSSWNNNLASVGRGNLKPSLGPDPMVQAAAVAAGARIAPASAAASLLKAAQSGNVVHIRPGVPLTKSGLPNQALNSTRMSSGMNAVRGPSGAVVHYIRTGSGALPPIIPTVGVNGSKSCLQQSKYPLAKASGNGQASHPVGRTVVQVAHPQASPPSHAPISSQSQSSTTQFKSPAQISARITATKSQGVPQISASSDDSTPIAGLVGATVACIETCNVSSGTTSIIDISASNTSMAITSDSSQVNEAVIENLDHSKAAFAQLSQCSSAENARVCISSPPSKEASHTEVLPTSITSSLSVENKLEPPSTSLCSEKLESCSNSDVNASCTK